MQRRLVVTTTQATYTASTSVAPGTLGVTATSVKDDSKAFTATVSITAIAAGGQIAFQSIRDGETEIYVMNADGTGVLRLTVVGNGFYSGGLPFWSPDRTKIAFSSDRDGNDAPSGSAIRSWNRLIRAPRRRSGSAAPSRWERAQRASPVSLGPRERPLIHPPCDG
jgi:WD40 repeat protein